MNSYYHKYSKYITLYINFKYEKGNDPLRLFIHLFIQDKLKEDIIRNQMAMFILIVAVLCGSLSIKMCAIISFTFFYFNH